MNNKQYSRRRGTFITLALILVLLLFLAFKVYPNVRYSSFNLTVRGKHTISISPLAQGRETVKSSYVNGLSYFDGLKSDWWARPYQLYAIDSPPLMDFKLSPTINGNFVLMRIPSGAVVPIQVETLNGTRTSVLVPGEWYKVHQLGGWFTIMLQWE